MDPLSIATAFVGLTGAVASVYTILRSVISKARDAPQEIHTLSTEMTGMYAAIASLQRIAQRISELPRYRANLISLDQLVATLTDSVLLISELETLVEPFKAMATEAHPMLDQKVVALKDRLQVTFQSSRMTVLIERLQRTKASLNLLFNIMQWYGCKTFEQTGR